MSIETATRIKKIREYRNYTQTYMADKLNISQNAYSKIENGSSKLTTDRLEEIAHILDVPADVVLSQKNIFNLENNQIDKFYIENLYEDNKEFMLKMMDNLRSQMELIKEQNAILIGAIERLGKGE